MCGIVWDNEYTMRWSKDPAELKKVRKRLGITQKALGEKCDPPIPRWMVADIEAGRRPFTDVLSTPIWRALADIDFELKRQRESPLKKLVDGTLTVSDLTRMQESIARSFGSMENFRQTMRDARELGAKQRQIEELWDEIKRLRVQVAELRDLLGLETNAALARAKADELRDRLND